MEKDDPVEDEIKIREKKGKLESLLDLNICRRILPNIEQRNRFLNKTRVFSKNIKNWKGRKKPIEDIKSKKIKKLEKKIIKEKNWKNKNELREKIQEIEAVEEFDIARRSMKTWSKCKEIAKPLLIQNICEECSEPYFDLKEHCKICIFF